MKSALILSLAGSAVAAPSFGSFIDALFGGSDNNAPNPSDLPNFPPIGTGSGIPFPFPTASGAPFPTGSDGALPFPIPGSDSHVKPTKSLHIDYQLAPTAAPAIKKRNLKYRQLGSSALPSFSLFDPSAIPTATEPASGIPTNLPGLPSGTETPSFPTDAPTGYPTPPVGGPTAPIPFPTGDVPFPSGEAPFPTNAPFPTAPAGTGFPFPGAPSTLETLTRGPQPTSAPEAPGEEDSSPENGNAWLEWISNLLTGGKGGE